MIGSLSSEIEKLPPVRMIHVAHQAVYRNCRELETALLWGGPDVPRRQIVRDLDILSELESYLFYCASYPQVWEVVGDFLKRMMHVQEEDPGEWIAVVHTVLREIALGAPEGTWVH